MTSLKSAYSDEQIDQYLEHIKVPEPYRRHAKPQPNLHTLEVIQQHHLSRIPFDNIQIHYSTTREILLEPQVIFNKLVLRQHGGYCMEHSTLFAEVLLALGFTLYTAGARPQKRENGIPTGRYYGWTHMVNIVTTPSGEPYVADVGFGGDASIRPVPLQENTITPNLGSQEMRLVKERLEYFRNSHQWIWVYQTRNGPDKPWNSNYCFTETEFIPQDFGVMSFWTSTHTESHMSHTIIAVRMLMEDGKIYGKVMMNGADLKRNTGGRTQLLKTCLSEEERVATLEEHFGIVLRDDERNAIQSSRARIS